MIGVWIESLTVPLPFPKWWATWIFYLVLTLSRCFMPWLMERPISNLAASPQQMSYPKGNIKRLINFMEYHELGSIYTPVHIEAYILTRLVGEFIRPSTRNGYPGGWNLSGRKRSDASPLPNRCPDGSVPWLNSLSGSPTWLNRCSVSWPRLKRLSVMDDACRTKEAARLLFFTWWVSVFFVSP